MDESAEALRTLLRNPAVVTIDLHRGHLDPEVATLPLPADAAEALVARVVPILDEYRGLGLPVVHLITSYRDPAEILSNPYWRFQAERPASPRRAIAEHNLEGRPGLELMPGILRHGDVTVETKKRYDCFLGTDLEFILRSGGHESILLLGVNTNSCVIATGIAASVRDFSVFFLDEGIATMLGQKLHDAARTVIEASFGWFVTQRQVMDEIRELRTGGDQKS
ncbi:cysteine hydrolase [bacterium]|nr:cysteine hydrolase [bacterium]